MDSQLTFESVLHSATFIAMLVCIPLAAAGVYYVLLLHQSIRNEERFAELKKREGRRRERLRRFEEAKRLADPFFHFNISKAMDIDEAVDAALAKERGFTRKVPSSARDKKILKAIEEGRLILLDTPIEDCAPGMIVGRPLDPQGLVRGDELTPAAIEKIRQTGMTSVPILYNPNRVAGALSGAAA